MSMTTRSEVERRTRMGRGLKEEGRTTGLGAEDRKAGQDQPGHAGLAILTT